ncbi:MAG TPA: hypothetical protein VHP31_08105 [Caproicibacter sp.]|nr:hypothetical protein [Caproicibacter sp.]
MRKEEEGMSPVQCAGAAALRRQEEYMREMAVKEAAAGKKDEMREEKLGRRRCEGDRKGKGKGKQKDGDEDAESMKNRAFSIRNIKGAFRDKLERARNKLERTTDKPWKKTKFARSNSGPEGERERDDDVSLMSGDLGEERERGNAEHGADAHEHELREARWKATQKNRKKRRYTRKEDRRGRRRYRDGEGSESRSESEERNGRSYHISYGPAGAWGCVVM